MRKSENCAKFSSQSVCSITHNSLQTYT